VDSGKGERTRRAHRVRAAAESPTEPMGLAEPKFENSCGENCWKNTSRHIDAQPVEQFQLV